MNTPDPLDTLLVSALQELTKGLPAEASAVAAYLQLEQMACEVDDEGNPTKQAHRARARLRNGLLVEETSEKSKAKVRQQKEKIEREIAKFIGRGLVLLVANRTYDRKLDHIQAHEARLLPAEKSREQHDPESRFALAQPFIDKLVEHGCSPSAMGKLKASMADFIALLINAYATDPKLENPDNIWNRVVRAGVIEAYQKNLDEDHLRAIAQAACERDAQDNEWAKKAIEELSLPAGMDPQFLEGAARLRDAAMSLSPGEGEAYCDAMIVQDERDVELLANVLGLDPQLDRLRLMTVLDITRKAAQPLAPDWKLEMQLAIMKQEIDQIAPHEKWSRDWQKELLERLEILAERLDTMDSVQAFNALLQNGLAASEADFKFLQRLERDIADGFFISLENKVRDACKSASRFKIFERDVRYDFEGGYQDIPAREWTGEDWIKVYGSLPGEDKEDCPNEEVDFHKIAAEAEGEEFDAVVEAGSEDIEATLNLPLIEPAEENSPAGLSAPDTRNAAGKSSVKADEDDRDCAPASAAPARDIIPHHAPGRAGKDPPRLRPTPLFTPDEELWEDD